MQPNGIADVHLVTPKGKKLTISIGPIKDLEQQIAQDERISQQLESSAIDGQHPQLTDTPPASNPVTVVLAPQTTSSSSAGSSKGCRSSDSGSDGSMLVAQRAQRLIDRIRGWKKENGEEDCDN